MSTTCRSCLVQPMRLCGTRGDLLEVFRLVLVVSNHATRRSAIRPEDRRRRGIDVSTHALTLNATQRGRAAAQALAAVSTHAPTRSATRGAACRRRSPTGFNPRAHAERDGAGPAGADVRTVSTHAPTRSATPCSPWATWPCTSFNPRAHAERDGIEKGSFVAPVVATHAPTRSATVAVPVLVSAMGQFQPTRPRGARRAHISSISPAVRVSTHAPTRSATSTFARCSAFAHVFQPTRPRGARHSQIIRVLVAMSFQPTRPRGARPRPTRLWRPWGMFQPTRPRGARPLPCVPTAMADSMFQPTRPRGARHERRLARVQRLRVSTHAPTRSATLSLFWPYWPFQGFNPRAHAERDGGKCPASSR